MYFKGSSFIFWVEYFGVKKKKRKNTNPTTQHTPWPGSSGIKNSTQGGTGRKAAGSGGQGGRLRENVPAGPATPETPRRPARRARCRGNGSREETNSRRSPTGRDWAANGASGTQPHRVRRQAGRGRRQAAPGKGRCWVPGPCPWPVALGAHRTSRLREGHSPRLGEDPREGAVRAGLSVNTGAPPLRRKGSWQQNPKAARSLTHSAQFQGGVR